LSHAAELVSRLSAHPKKVAHTVDVDDLMTILGQNLFGGDANMRDKLLRYINGDKSVIQ
jgi:hypothetical protein